MGSQTEDQLPRRERSGEDRAQSKQRQRRAEGRSHQKARGDVRGSLHARVGAPAEPRPVRLKRLGVASADHVSRVVPQISNPDDGGKAGWSVHF